MAEYDGSIRINTNISTKDAKVQLSALQHTIVKTADEIASLRSKMDAMKDVKFPTKEFTDLEKELKKAVSEYDKLQAKMEEPGKPTEKYKALQKDLQKAQSELEKLAEQQAEMEEMGLPLSPASIKQLADASDRVDSIKEKMNALEEAGKAFVPKVDTKELDEAKKKVDDLKQKMEDLKASGKDTVLGIDTDEYANLSRQLGNEQKALAKYTAQYMATGVSTVISKAKSTYVKLAGIAKGAFSKITKSVNQSSKATSTFGTRLKSLALSMLIFNQISKAFRAMSSAIKEGFTNLYNEVGGFKSSIDSLKASMTTLKNSFAAAFRPLVEVAVPYIQKAIDAIANLMNIIGQFTAAITGQKMYTKAIKQTTAAIEDENAAQNKQLSGLDKLNNLSSGSGSGADSGVSTQMFEENAPIDSKFIEMANKVKDVLAQIFQPIKTAWENQGQFVMDSWKYALEEIGLLTQSVGKDFLAVWNQPETISVLENILIIVGDIGLVVGNLAARFREAWEANDVGLHILESIRDIFAIIIGHIRSAADYTVEWSKGLDFYPLLESINGLLEALKPLTDNIGSGLEWFYKNVLLPIAGWTIEDAIPAFLDMLSAAIGAVNEVIEALKPLGTWLWEKFLQPLGQWTGDAIIVTMQTITDLLTKFGDWISENQEAIMSITAIIGLFFASWKTIELLAFIQQSGGVVAALKQITTALLGATAAKLADKAETMAITALYAKDFIVNLAKGTAELIKQAAQFAINTAAKIANTAAQVAMTAATVAWNAACAIATAATTAFGAAVAFLTSPIGIAIAAIGAIIAIGVLLYKNWDEISAKAKEVWDFVKQKFQKFGSWIQNVFETDWEESFGTIGGIMNAFQDTVSSIWESIKKIFGGFIDFIAGVFTGDWERAWDGIVKIFSGVGDAIKGIVNGILGVVESLANGVINGINFVIGALNKIHIDIPGPIAKLTGFESFGFDIPELKNVSIPRLATGTVVPPNNEFLAVLGDNKREPEVVSPLSTMKQANKEAILEVLSELGLTGGQRKSGNETYVFQVDGKTFFEIMRGEAEQYFKRTGRAAFPI